MKKTLEILFVIGVALVLSPLITVAMVATATIKEFLRSNQGIMDPHLLMQSGETSLHVANITIALLPIGVILTIGAILGIRKLKETNQKVK